MTLSLTPMLLLLSFLFLAPSLIQCDGGKGLAVVSSIGKGAVVKGAVAKGAVAKGVAKAAVGGPAKLKLSTLLIKLLAAKAAKNAAGKDPAKSAKRKLSKLLIKLLAAKAVKAAKDAKGPVLAIKAGKAVVTGPAKAIKKKMSKLLAKGALALAIIKGVIVKTNWQYFLGLHIGKKVGKRDVSNLEQLQLVDAALELANEVDSGNCVAKLLCHLETLPEASLSPAGLTLRKALGNVNKSDYLNTKTSHGVYGLATAVGATLGRSNARTCDTVFQTCPVDHNELLEVLDSTFTN